MECSPFLLLLSAAFAAMELLWELLLALLALSLHELAHVLAARGVRCAVSSVQLQPFGFVARISGATHGLRDELVIFSAGILFSAMAGCAGLSICELLGEEHRLLTYFSRMNLLIAAVNMLPAPPLDGGRILRALLLKRRPMERVDGALFFVSLSAGAGLVGLGAALLCVGVYNATFFTMGVFLVLAAMSERRRRVPKKVCATISRSLAIVSGEPVEVNCMAVHESVLARDAIRCMKTYKYNVIIVLNETMSALGQLGESQLIRAAARGDTLSEALIYERQREG